MQPADLNLTTDVVGHQRMLFVRLPSGAPDTGLARSIDRLGEGMENMHEVDVCVFVCGNKAGRNTYRSTGRQ